MLLAADYLLLTTSTVSVMMEKSAGPSPWISAAPVSGFKPCNSAPTFERVEMDG